ncbi:MAG: hypothetical protein WCC90_05410 [Methylocella sp.]
MAGEIGQIGEGAFGTEKQIYQMAGRRKIRRPAFSPISVRSKDFETDRGVHSDGTCFEQTGQLPSMR